MQGLSIENRIVKVGRLLSKDLAYHIQSRYMYGTVAIATDNPVVLLSTVRKQWLRLIRLAQLARASTLDRQRQQEIDQTIQRMQRIGFTAQDPASDPIAYISFATVAQFRRFPPMCATLYIISHTEKLDRYMLTSWMRQGGAVVIYDQR